MADEAATAGVEARILDSLGWGVLVVGRWSRRILASMYINRNTDEGREMAERGRTACVLFCRGKIAEHRFFLLSSSFASPFSCRSY